MDESKKQPGEEPKPKSDRERLLQEIILHKGQYITLRRRNGLTTAGTLSQVPEDYDKPDAQIMIDVGGDRTQPCWIWVSEIESIS